VDRGGSVSGMSAAILRAMHGWIALPPPFSHTADPLFEALNIQSPMNEHGNLQVPID